MTTMRDSRPAAGAAWRRVAALMLGVAAVGLPINDIAGYALLVALAVVVFTGEVRGQAKAWIAAAVLVAITVGGQFLLAPPRIEEGHNVFLPGAAGAALERGLPPEVYRELTREFDAVYPPAVRCKPGSAGCWQDHGFPDSTFAFSADGIWRKHEFSRAVTTLDFSDPVWLRLGFINELRYNWDTAAPDVHRADRDRRFWMGLHRWHLAMPWFEMVRVPAAYVGGELCWRGEVLWEGDGEHFSRWTGDSCRPIEPADAGRRIVGIAIKPDTLAMQLAAPWPVRLRLLAGGALALAGVLGLALVLVRLRLRRTIVPIVLIGLSVAAIALDDASFLGGVRPFDGGDDGLFYDGVGRLILHKLLAGDVSGFLMGGEKVFYYGGPGLRYFRALEHIVFGESYLGYLSLILLLPFVVYRLFRRFLPARSSLALIILFIAVPVGVLFGTAFTQYVKWASRGFADPAAYVLFLAGLVAILGPLDGPRRNFAPDFFGALLLALGICMKPIVAPAAAVMLGGAGLAAVIHRQWLRLAALCIGFTPVFSMALHNWIFGHAFVLFSSNSRDSNLLVMPPSAYVDAVRRMLSLDFSGLGRVAAQLAHWLSGPAESYWTIPLNGLGVVILIYVVARGRHFDPWLRLIGGAALAQHVVALFYNAEAARYHFLTWLLTMLVVMVWFHQVAIDWLCRRYPDLAARISSHPGPKRLASGLAWLQKSAA
ncbi:MAG TPA: hypothetical protein VHV56_07200 [Pseudolabrys sp.]|nr:hypothetical protein [Pseudolabrys sp.]